MRPIRTFTIMGALALAPQMARAADILPPPPVVEPLRGSIVETVDSGWYLRGDVGVGWNQISSESSSFTTNSLGGTAPAINTASVSLGSSAFIDAGFGYQFNNWFRADVTAEYRSTAAYRKVLTYQAFCPASFCQDAYQANIGAAVFMANGYFDLGTWYGITPYIGGGVGYASLSFDGLTDVGAGQPGSAGGYANDRTSGNFAYALMAGLSYSINPRLKLELGYRYLNMGDAESNAINCTDLPSCFFEKQKFTMASHDFRLGMRWMFADAITSTSYVDSSAALPSSHYANSGCGTCGYSNGAYAGGGAVVGGGGVVSSGPVVASRPGPGGYQTRGY